METADEDEVTRPSARRSVVLAVAANDNVGVSKPEPEAPPELADWFASIGAQCRAEARLADQTRRMGSVSERSSLDCFGAWPSAGAQRATGFGSSDFGSSDSSSSDRTRVSGR